jgi:hypothetical protein
VSALLTVGQLEQQEVLCRLLAGVIPKGGTIMSIWVGPKCHSYVTLVSLTVTCNSALRNHPCMLATSCCLTESYIRNFSKQSSASWIVCGAQRPNWQSFTVIHTAYSVNSLVCHLFVAVCLQALTTRLSL